LHALIGEPTLADAILDRIVHNAHRLKLKGDSLRTRRLAGTARLTRPPQQGRGDVAFAHIPTASAAALGFNTTRKTMRADRDVPSRTHRPCPIIPTSALDHSTSAMASDDRQQAFATPADIGGIDAGFNRNRWPTSIGMPGRINRNPHQTHVNTIYKIVRDY